MRCCKPTLVLQAHHVTLMSYFQMASLHWWTTEILQGLLWQVLPWLKLLSKQAVASLAGSLTLSSQVCFCNSRYVYSQHHMRVSWSMCHTVATRSI